MTLEQYIKQYGIPKSHYILCEYYGDTEEINCKRYYPKTNMCALYIYRNTKKTWEYILANSNIMERMNILEVYENNNEIIFD